MATKSALQPPGISHNFLFPCPTAFCQPISPFCPSTQPQHAAVVATTKLCTNRTFIIILICQKRSIDRVDHLHIALRLANL